MIYFFWIHFSLIHEHYHKRSNIESTNAVIKRIFGETLKSENQVVQVNELLVKIIEYNLKIVIHEMHENGINPDFSQVKVEKTITV
ncbi:hypothetical protein [Methanosarcina horonobensis]|uniref:hypothetical protein n=1 Tax=Methanosarcina horonobensis TaxID=418008 RepID=UPI001EF49FDF|nr:hypothetical protein [Methanosarcina horonobensis]